MATLARITKIFDEELTERASEKREQAGETWKLQKMEFYFPGNEDTVDLFAIAVLEIALQEDGTTVTNQVKQRVRTLIGRATKVSSAIDTIFLTTFPPQPTS